MCREVNALRKVNHLRYFPKFLGFVKYEEGVKKSIVLQFFSDHDSMTSHRLLDLIRHKGPKLETYQALKVGFNELELIDLRISQRPLLTKAITVSLSGEPVNYQHI